MYLHAHHLDIMRFLDTKRENADEKIRIKTLSLGVVIPDITFTSEFKKICEYLPIHKMSETPVNTGYTGI